MRATGETRALASPLRRVHLPRLKAAYANLQAVIDGPSTGVERQVIRFRDLVLTPFVIKLTLGARSATVKKSFDASGVAEKWANSKWAKTLAARETRKNTTDCTSFVKQRNANHSRALPGPGPQEAASPRHELRSQEGPGLILFYDTAGHAPRSQKRSGFEYRVHPLWVAGALLCASIPLRAARLSRQA